MISIFIIVFKRAQRVNLRILLLLLLLLYTDAPPPTRSTYMIQANHSNTHNTYYRNPKLILSIP